MSEQRRGGRAGFGGDTCDGRLRLDQLDGNTYASGRCLPGQRLARRVVLNQVPAYLYGLLGRGQATAEDWLDAYTFFFTAVSHDPGTWGSSMIEAGDGHHKVLAKLTAAEMRSRCFDRHYDVAGFGQAMPIATFRRLLLERRRQIVADNLPVITQHLSTIRAAAARRGEYLSPTLRDIDSIEGNALSDILTSPILEGVAALIYPHRAAADVVPIASRHTLARAA